MIPLYYCQVRDDIFKNLGKSCLPTALSLLQRHIVSAATEEFKQGRFVSVLGDNILHPFTYYLIDLFALSGFLPCNELFHNHQKLAILPFCHLVKILSCQIGPESQNGQESIRRTKTAKNRKESGRGKCCCKQQQQQHFPLSLDRSRAEKELLPPYTVIR